MDEKRKNEVPDEQLDSVSGGLCSRFNPQTGKFDIFWDDGSYAGSASSSAAAVVKMKALSQIGQQQSNTKFF